MTLKMKMLTKCSDLLTSTHVFVHSVYLQLHFLRLHHQQWQPFAGTLMVDCLKRAQSYRFRIYFIQSTIFASIRQTYPPAAGLPTADGAAAAGTGAVGVGLAAAAGAGRAARADGGGDADRVDI